MRGLVRGEKRAVLPRWGSWRRWVRAPERKTNGAASTAVAGRSRRLLQAGAVVRYLVGEAPGYGCQWLSVEVLRFQKKR